MPEDQKKETPEIPEIGPAENNRDGGGKTFRDWWAFTLSTLAFGISAVGFYVNSLHETDDLRVRLDLPSVRPVEGNKGAPRFQLEGSPNAVFINAGTSSIAIHTVNIWHAQTNEAVTEKLSAGTRPTEDKCDSYSRVAHSETDLKAFVIKPGDVAIRSLKINDSGSLEMKQASGDAEDRYAISVCYVFTLTTPLQGSVRSLVRFVNYAYVDKNAINGSEARPEPFVLVRYSTNAFQRWWREKFYRD